MLTSQSLSAFHAWVLGGGGYIASMHARSPADLPP